MTDLLKEIRLAARTLWRVPGFTIAAVLTLAAGIGANALVFMVVDAVLVRALPFRDAGRIVYVSLVTRDTPKYPLSIPDLIEYQRETRSLADMAGVAGANVSLTGSGDAERIQGVRASGNLFSMLGVEAVLGRTLLPDDDHAKAAVVVLTDGLWRRRFGGDRGVLGRSIVLNGDAYEVVGVLPPRFRFMAQSAEFAIPLAAEHDPARADRQAMNMLRVAARLAPGATAEQAAAEMTAMARRLQKQYPDSNATKQGVSVTPYRDEIVGEVRPVLVMLFGAVACVFLIGCANLAGLTLVRAAGRSREMAVRAALGATRWQLTRQILIEALLLSCVGGALGFVMTFASVPFLSSLKPRLLPRAHEIGVDLRVLAFAAVAAVLAGLLVGLWPALRASRLALAGAIHGSAGAAGEAAVLGRTARSRARRLLVAAEVALSMLLLAGAGLFLRSLDRLLSVDTGFDSRNVLIARLALPKGKYGNSEAMVQFHDRLHPMLAALPGVKSAGMISIAPMSGVLGSADFWDADHPPADPHAVEAAHYRVIGKGCIEALGMRLVRGRGFAPSDDARSPAVVIVNQRLVDLTFPGVDPIGRHLMVEDNLTGARRLEIVGVVADVRHESLDVSAVPDVHVPVAQIHPNLAPWVANNQFWALRTAGDPRPLARAVQVAVREIDPDVAASDIRTFDDYLDDATGTRRLSTRLIGAFALGALFLAAMGLYGLVAFSVGQRTREIGIRMALGARAADVQRLVVGEAVRLSVAGLLAGLAAALLLTRLMSGLLYQIPAHDPLTYAAVAALLALVTLMASWLPARQAGRVDPATALRSE
jgi:predicted permease